jgi:site-specific DNA-methyltransferase (adenine-specific)
MSTASTTKASSSKQSKVGPAQRTGLYKGNCLTQLKKLADCSVDSIVTDPPYELGFAGKSWDSSGIAYSVELWGQCLRVLKPGGHLLAFGGSRTYHRMTVAIEDAGFGVRDSMVWVHSQGMPKSLDASKAIDKAAGAVRQVVGTKKTNVGIQGGKFSAGSKTGEVNVTIPATADAKRWQGWGSALKPAQEMIVVARKPLDGTVAHNILKWGTGGLNIDASRVGNGRWPANVLFDEVAAAELNRQTASPAAGSGASSGASRFFYCAKPSRAERKAGLGALDSKHVTQKPLTLMRYLVKLVTPPGGVVLDVFLGSGTTAVAATLEGFNWVGCELTKEYWPLIAKRVKWAEAEVARAHQVAARTPAAGKTCRPKASPRAKRLRAVVA